MISTQSMRLEATTDASNTTTFVDLNNSQTLTVLKFENIPEGTYRLRVVDRNSGAEACESVTEDFTFTQSHVTFTTAKTDVTCPSGVDGSITITAEGATGLSYGLWRFDTQADAETFIANPNWDSNTGLAGRDAATTGLTSGYYVAAVKDNVSYTMGSGCTLYATADQIVKIAEPEALTVTRLDAVSVTSCDESVENGQVLVRVEGGTAPYSISLDGGAAVETVTGDYRFTGLRTGDHTISVMDARGCAYSGTKDNVNVPIYEKVQVALGSYDMNDSGTTDKAGTADVTISGGVPRNPGETTKYYVYEVTLAGSTGSAKKWHVDTETPDATQGVSKTTAGDIKIEFSNLEPDFYTVTVRDASASSSSCQAQTTFTLNKLTAELTTKNPDCVSQKNGTASVEVGGLNGHVRYRWFQQYTNSSNTKYYVELPQSVSANTSMVTGLDKGNYALQIFDLKANAVMSTGTDGLATTADNADHKTAGSYKFIEFEMDYNRDIQITPSIVDERCYAANDGEISLVIQGADANKTLTYKWTGPNGFTSTEKDIKGLRPGSYTIVVTDEDGCQATKAGNLVNAQSRIQFNLYEDATVRDCQEYSRRLTVYNPTEEATQTAANQAALETALSAAGLADVNAAQTELATL